MKERPILFSGPMVRALLAGTKTQTRRVCKPAQFSSLSGVVEVPDPQERGQVYNGSHFGDEEGDVQFASPYGGRGDRLWVREAFRFPESIDHLSPSEIGQKALAVGYPKPWCPIQFEADGVRRTPQEWRDFVTPPKSNEAGRLRAGMHMPRWASRITLEVTGVRVERLMGISEADAKAEGCARLYDDEPGYVHRDEPDWSLCPQCGGTRLYTAFNPATGGAIPDTDCEKCDTYVKRYQHLWTSINGPESWVANPWVWVVNFKVLP